MKKKRKQEKQSNFQDLDTKKFEEDTLVDLTVVKAYCIGKEGRFKDSNFTAIHVTNRKNNEILEMGNRQFSTITELLTKLKDDLTLSFPSFIREFIGDPNDGVTHLLDALKAIQLAQSNITGKEKFCE